MSHGSTISKNDAKTLIQRYKTTYGDTIKRAFVFDKSLIESVINESTEVDGVRIYMGLKEDDEQCVVVVGVNSNGEDLTDNTIIEMATPCPSYCDPSSYFNQ